MNHPETDAAGDDDLTTPPAEHDATSVSAPAEIRRGVDQPPNDSAPRSHGGNFASRTIHALRHPHNYTSAVYGSVLAATVIVSSGDLRSPVTLAVLLLVSGLTFWIAHVYAATVAGVHGGWHAGAIRAGMWHEWPVAAAAVPPAIAALICGILPDVSRNGGVWVALLVAIGEQQIWGYAAVRKAKLTGPALTRTMLLNVFMGFIIVALKLGIGH